MEKTRLETEMKRLWKETFSDSDEYINLIFDTYFDEGFVEYEENEDGVVAALLAIPYNFGTENRFLRGLYLCGLATKPEFRRKGIMTRLYDHIKFRAHDRGYDFIFLIPADSGLSLYYRDLGMTDCFYRVRSNYTKGHDFVREYNNYLDKEDPRVEYIKKLYCDSLSHEFYTGGKDDVDEEIFEFVHHQQQTENHWGLLHSERDLKTVLRENKLSGGCISTVRRSDGKLTGVGFATEEPADDSVWVRKLVSADKCTYYRILDEIKRKYPERRLTLFQIPKEQKRMALWQEYTTVPMPQSPQTSLIREYMRPYTTTAENVESAGMIEILNIREILKFLTEIRNDSKYSILVKDPFSDDTVLKVDAEDGSVKFEELDRDTEVPRGNYVMSLKNLEEILCRKPDKDNTVLEATGLPRLCLNMALLLE